MTASLKYERLKINENKCRYSFEEENNDFEALEKLAEHFPQSFTFNDILKKAEASELNFFESKIQNLDIKEQILLNSLREIKMSLKNDESKYILFEPQETENIDYNKSINIFNEINKVVHKTLHKKKMINGKEIKECIFYDDLNKQLTELDEIDKNISNLKLKNKYFEFIGIKSIMISLTNLMMELIQNYLAKNEKLVNNKENEEGGDQDKNIDFDLEKIEKLNLIEANIFEDIYKDFVVQSNVCSELEEYFKLSLNSFREKYQMNFTLSELYTDIFWNNIFHNKKLCSLFINSYLNDEIYGDIKIYLQKILKIIYSAQIPLKHQIVDLLGLHELENNEENDLMTLIVSEKTRNHPKIIKLEIEKENANKKNQKILEEENTKNININKIIESNNIKTVETNKYNNIIIANDISKIKNKKQIIIAENNDSNDNNIEINVESNDKEKEKKIKEEKNHLNKKKSNANIGLDDMEHKTVDEIFNYINDDQIVRNKKKKKSRKNRKAKKEENNIEENTEEIEDNIVIKFKEDLSDKFIHAKTITKIKPFFSEEWINKITTNYN